MKWKKNGVVYAGNYSGGYRCFKKRNMIRTLRGGKINKFRLQLGRRE
jgi:hypothetical protein